VQNPAVRTRKHEVVSWSVASSNTQSHWKNVSPKKPSYVEKRLRDFHQAQNERPCYEKLGKTKLGLI
jgi:hypothetical protein